MRRIVRPDSSESFGMGRDEYLAGIWRISGIGDESLFLLYKRVGAECVDVHLHKRHEIERICVWLLTLGDVEKFTAVLRIVGDGCRGTAIGHWNGKVALQIIPHKIIAVAIARNAVVGTFHSPHYAGILVSLHYIVIEQIPHVGRYDEILVGHIFREQRSGHRWNLHLVYVAHAVAFGGIIECVPLGSQAASGLTSSEMTRPVAVSVSRARELDSVADFTSFIATSRYLPSGDRVADVTRSPVAVVEGPTLRDSDGAQLTATSSKSLSGTNSRRGGGSDALCHRAWRGGLP